MALNRSSNRFSSNIWPGFVDAMTTLLLVLTFVLTIFTIMQSLLRDQITDQDSTIATQTRQIADQRGQMEDQEARLAQLGDQVAGLSAALSTSEERGRTLETDLVGERARVEELGASLADAEKQARARAARIAAMNQSLQASQQQLAARADELAAAESRLTDFEAEVAALMAARDTERRQAAATLSQTQDELEQARNDASAAELAVASARAEIDAQAESARLAAARREALQAMIADLKSKNSGIAATQGKLAGQLTQLEAQLSEADAARLTEAEAAKALREQLETSDTELTAMTLALEESRKKAENTLTLLAAAEAARDDLRDKLDTETQAAAASASDAERQAALLSTAQAKLAEQEELSSVSQRRVALLNEQVASLTAQMASLQSVLDASGEEQKAAELRVEDLGQQLNAALLRTSEERQRRLALEEEARSRAEAEALDLAKYRSEFFGRLSQILQGRQGVQVVGDRFVFDSEVLFQPGEANLSDAGRTEISSVADMLGEISADIPKDIDWIIRVDGHTDNLPLSGLGRYRDNWELSQARALAVVRYMIDDLGFPRDRVAAAGFADTRPVDPADTTEARARNRRIELKLTER